MLLLVVKLSMTSRQSIDQTNEAKIINVNYEV